MTEFEKLVAKVMSTAYLEPPSAAPRQAKPVKKHRFLKKLDNMSKEQQELLVLLLSEKVATITLHGETYAWRRSDAGFVVRSLHDGEPEHTVLADFSACSCQDNRFRGRTCKHMAALKEVMT